MNLGDITLVAPYTTGSGIFLTSNMDRLLLGLGFVPTQATVYTRNLSASVTYPITHIGASRIVVGTALVGSDQAFSAGDLVLLNQGNASQVLDVGIGSTSGLQACRGLTAWQQQQVPVVLQWFVAGTAATGTDLGTDYLLAQNLTVVSGFLYAQTATGAIGPGTYDILYKRGSASFTTIFAGGTPFTNINPSYQVSAAQMAATNLPVPLLLSDALRLDCLAVDGVSPATNVTVQLICIPTPT